MSRIRTFPWLAIAWLVSVPVADVTAQSNPTRLDGEFAPYKKVAVVPEQGQTKLTNFINSGIPGTITPEDKAILDGMAKYYVFRLTDPKYYTMVETPGSSDIKPRQPSLTVNQLLTEVRSKIHPLPGNVNDKGDWDAPKRTYVAEFGQSLDKAIQLVMTDKNPPPIIRTAAARMLATVAESGAPAHWLTVLKLLSNPNVEPEVAYYALKAAEGLFGAYEFKKLWKYQDKFWVTEKDYVALAQTVDNYINKPLPFLYRVAGSTRKSGEPVDLKTLTADEIAVTRFYRTQALRALGRITTDSIGGNDNADTKVFHPNLTLARFALNDPTISPAPRAAEIGEAVIGLCHCLPTLDNQFDETILAVAHGTKLFALPQSGAVGEDRSVPWKIYAERLKLALTNWKASIDKINQINPAQKALVGKLLTVATESVFTPLAKPSSGAVGARLDLSKISEWIAQNTPEGKTHATIFRDSGLKIPFPSE